MGQPIRPFVYRGSETLLLMGILIFLDIPDGEPLTEVIELGLVNDIGRR
jgi:hypothetical protein